MQAPEFQGNSATRYYHCVVTEKVPAKYRSLKMADASLDKCSIFVNWGGIARTRQQMSVHRDRKIG